eukprot:3724719-Rhodomonas_salina.2
MYDLRIPDREESCKPVSEEDTKVGTALCTRVSWKFVLLEGRVCTGRTEVGTRCAGAGKTFL